MLKDIGPLSLLNKELHEEAADVLRASGLLERVSSGREQPNSKVLQTGGTQRKQIGKEQGNRFFSFCTENCFLVFPEPGNQETGSRWLSC